MSFPLWFKCQEMSLGGFRFSPVFSMMIPARPIPSLTGYVSNLGSHNVTVFDKKLNKVLAVIVTGGVRRMALNQDREGLMWLYLEMTPSS